MKNILRIFAAGIVLALSLSLSSCNEKEFLTEKPLSIYTADNALTTYSDFHSAVNYLHRYWRDWSTVSTSWFPLCYHTDLGYCGIDKNANDISLMMTADGWGGCYNACFILVCQANLILTRLEKAESLTAEQVKEIRAEALFFRAFAYRCLGHMYGGVPIIDAEITTPRRDFVRASREEVYKFCQNDLTEAASLAKDIDQVPDGAVSKQLCQHFLAEIDITLKDYDGAIAAAKAVINHPATALMTKRFGTSADEEGSAFGDLFKLHNQNRSAGNTEGLWVQQYEFNLPGVSGDNINWCFVPCLAQIVLEYEGTSATFLIGNMVELGARGRGWIQFTDWVLNGIWQNDEGDDRNAPNQIIRDVRCNNPASAAYGMWMVKDDLFNKCNVPINGFFYPIFIKTQSGWVPDQYNMKDAEGNVLYDDWGLRAVNNDATCSYTDTYAVRLAETYFLLAEACLDKGDKAGAAEAINVVRARSHAPLATADQMDIDYILDERLRELTGEELRAFTLCRLGLYADRNRRYNYQYLGDDHTMWDSTGKTIQDYNNLWPIPNSEIEKNTEAVLEQNPGY